MLRSTVRLLRAHPRLTALFGAISIAFSGVLYEFSNTSPETASFYRCLWGLPILLLAAYVEQGPGGRGRMDRRSIGIAAFAGVLFAGDLIFWHHTINLVGAGLATVLGNLQVVVVAIAAWLLFGERPTGRTLIALPIILLGVAFIAGVFGGLGGTNYGTNTQLGVLLGFLTALSYGCYLLVIRRISGARTAGPVAVSTTSTAVVALIVGLLIGSLDLTPGWQSMFWLILLGVSAQAFGYLFISLSLPRLPAVVTSIILHETPSPAQLLGVVCVIGGIAFATVPLSRLRRRPANSASAPAVGPG